MLLIVLSHDRLHKQRERWRREKLLGTEKRKSGLPKEREQNSHSRKYLLRFKFFRGPPSFLYFDQSVLLECSEMKM